MYGDKTYEGRIGNLGMTEEPAADFNTDARHLLTYVPHFRISEDEVCQVYEGFEVAAHEEGICCSIGEAVYCHEMNYDGSV